MELGTYSTFSSPKSDENRRLEYMLYRKYPQVSSLRYIDEYFPIHTITVKTIVFIVITFYIIVTITKKTR